MSKNNNVNPGQYKVRGRERQGEDIQPEITKQAFGKARKQASAKRKTGKKR